MTAFRQCEFYLLRYVPDVVKGEFVNVGVVLLESGDDASAFTDVRLTHDWRRVRCLDPEVDVGLLEALEQDLRSKLQSHVPEIINYKGPMSRREWLLNLIETGWSGTLQMTPATGILTHSPEAEIGILAKAYLESPQGQRAERVARGRHAISIAIREAFMAKGIWEHMWKDIQIGKYTGDNLKIDCGYKPNGTIHLFQPASLVGELELNRTKSLALSYQKFAPVMATAEKAAPILMAITEEGLNYNEPGIAFARQVLGESGVDVAPVSMMPVLAEQARSELKL
jgi:hypothetical protein